MSQNNSKFNGNKDDSRKKELERIRKWVEDRGRGVDKDKKDHILDESLINVNDELFDLYPDNIVKEIKSTRNKLSITNKSSNNYASLQLRLDYLENLPWRQLEKETINIDEARKILDEGHYGMKDLKEEVISYIHTSNTVGPSKNDVILLTGAPGTGKTSIARQIAKAMNRSFCKIPLGGVSSEIVIKGSSSQYTSSKPGEIIDALYRSKSRKIVILLDEIDKFATRSGTEEGAAALLDALDDEQQFVDRFISVPFDMQGVIFIATANDSSKIPSALKNRMTEIRIKGYNFKEKFHICKNIIFPRERANIGLKAGQVKIDDSVYERLVKDDYENEGVRVLTQKIRRICRIASSKINDSANKSYTMTYKRGLDFNLFSDDKKNYKFDSQVGRACTLSIDSYKGKITEIAVDSIVTRLEEKHRIIGSYNEIYREDIYRIWRLFNSQLEQFGIPKGTFEKNELTVQLHSCNSYKYESNHQLSIFCSLYSQITAIPLPINSAVIGEITLLGEIKSNDQTERYLKAALEKKCELIIIPKGYDDVKKSLNKKVCFMMVENISELISTYKFIKYLFEIYKNTDGELNKFSLSKCYEHHSKIESISKEKSITMRDAYLQYFKIENNEDKKYSLDSLVGLSDVKSLMNRLVIYESMSMKRRKQGLRTNNLGMHMAFTGNPGTGKTSVAKILGRQLYKKGLVKNSKFIEVTRDELVGKYIGQTEEKVQKYINDSMGGVLYIDEAHSLYVDSERDYGQIVISSLVKAMEKYRDSFVLILSGYKEEMVRMINSNPGLRDRINYKMHFEDYSVEELLEIFDSLCEEENYSIEFDAREILFERIKEDKLKADKNFSNGRYVRNIFEEIKVEQAMRIYEKDEISKEAMMQITSEDVVNMISNSSLDGFNYEGRSVIGF